MRAGKIDRVKRQLLRQAVDDNLDTMRGLPPRALRRARRLGRLWLRRAPLLLIPVTLAGSTYLARDETPVLSVAQAIPPARAGRIAGATQNAAMIDSIEPVSAAAFPLSVRRVILDAGHGGSDPGTTASDLAEKAITLDIQARLRVLLEAQGFEVVVTRADDRLIPLRERARLANSSDGDIFVSIHVNSLFSHTKAHGVETYYLGPTNDPSLTRLAATENDISGYSIADLRTLLERVYADVRRDQSHRLATAVQQRLYSDLRVVDPGLENWGVKRAPFIVLVATDMPAVLAEVGCLSNEREAAMLGRNEYRQQIAQALFDGIHAYAKKGI
ncbi:MAG TPA: N-acetylmuramoyl-L-alanine amidase [Thermoanaerobaculia bacterium]